MTAPLEEKVNVLLVDDRPKNLFSLEAILTDLGQNLFKSSSGPQALRFLLEREFAVIILDVNMPGMDGYETAAQIREQELNRDTPIIFLTDHEKADTKRLRGYSAGAVDYLVKPIAGEILRSKVKVFVDLARKTALIKRQIESERQARKAHEASEARFHDFASAAGDWFWETDAENRFIWVSDNFEAATGIRPEQLYGKSREEYVTAGRNIDAEPWKSHFAACRRREPFRDFRYPRTMPKGEKWLSVSGIPIFDAQGGFRGWRGVASDVTREVESERQAHAALSASEARFHDFASASGDWFWETDVENRFVWMSGAFGLATGEPVENFYGKRRDDLARVSATPGELAAEPWKSYLEAISKRVPFRDFRYRRTGLKGEQWFSTSGIPIFDAQGGFRGWRGVGSDITRQVEVERKAGEALQEQDRYLRELLDAIPTSVAVRDREGRHVLCNRAFAARWGLSPGEVIGKTLADLTPQSTQLKGAQVKDLETLAAGGAIEPYEVTFPDGAGAMHTWQISKVALTDERDAPNRLVSVGTDITRRKLAEGALQGALEEKELLLREIHHRVKNNLQVISALLALRSRKVVAPADRAVFEECGQRVRAMALLHENLYREGRFGKVELNAYLKGLAESTLASYARHDLSAEVRGDELSVDLDIAVPLAQIAAELLLNALKHGFPNGTGGRIELELAAEPEGGRMRIADDGVGLAPGFNLLGQDTLGMRVVSMLAEQIAGELSVERPARGAAFAVRWKANPA